MALVELTVDGARVANPERNESGVVLGNPRQARPDNSLELHVFRKLQDSLPASLTTQLELTVSGEPRELRLVQPLPAGFLPVAIEGELSARLDPDNVLRVQVRPGRFTLGIEARGPSPLQQVALGSRSAPWPAEEVWSFEARDRLRVVALEGAPLTDPTQAGVPEQWRQLPAYRMTGGTTLQVQQRSRGLSAQDANQLKLTRTAWLDFDGKGYTLLDRISGTMRQGWRLEMRPPYQLQSARLGDAEPLLVTEGAAGGTGLEVRTPDLQLAALARAPASGHLPALGWQARFMRAGGQLVVAPGYRLLAAFGPDAAPDAWLEQWRLLDIFAVLLISIVAWRMRGIVAGAIALVALVLTYQESGAAAWLWLDLLIAMLLLRLAPPGRLRGAAQVYRALALLALLVVLVPFIIEQLRLAVYPRLETATQAGVHVVADEVSRAPALDREFKKDTRVVGRLSSSIAAAPVQEVGVSGARRASPVYEADVRLQAGPPVPDWYYHLYRYEWSGPVDASATVHFLISPPWVTRLWRLLGIAAAITLLIELLRGDAGLLRRWWTPPGAVAAAALVCLIAALAPGGVQAAPTPDPQLLGELQRRLRAPPKCLPDCAAVLAADIRVAAGRLSITLELSALDGLGVPLPGTEPSWTPERVQLDGVPAGIIYRDAQGRRFVMLTPGRHTLHLEGGLQAVNTLALTFAPAPQRIDVSAPDWEVSGASNRRLVSGALQLTRHRVPGGSTGSATVPQESFPPFVSLERDFNLAQKWTAHTTLTRVAPPSRAFTVRVPLLAQESVTSEDVEVHDRVATVGLESGAEEGSFYSVLPRSDTLELSAGTDAPYSEHWVFEVAVSWHVDFEGVPATMPEDQSGPWRFEYYPRPGERLRLHISRPVAAPGGTVAFDAVQLDSRAGKRSTDTDLTLRYRSTQGGRHVLSLPAGAEVLQVTSDGEPVATRPEHGELSLSALPGEHTWTVRWQAAGGARPITRTAAAALAAPAGNVRLSLQLPEDRWILYAFGPGVGPAVLYWGELLCFGLLAWLIGRLRLTQLRTSDWLLLGLGLSTFSWSVLLLFGIFVAAFEWRSRTAPPVAPRSYKLLQLARISHAG